ncbi:MAG: hypothetical protein JXB05_36205 [Myxococcaceae bacterium]|nr:hypothetical protein [Myxococcaceae bacterium]
MIQGPDEIIACPHCGALHRRRTVLSGNTFGAEVWTDGWSWAPMLPQPPLISRCTRCSRFFWVGRAECLGELESVIAASGLQVQRLSIPNDWKAAPHVQPPDEAGWLEAIAQGLAKERDEERELRIQAWWEGNMPYRRDTPWVPFSQRAQAARDNLRALQTLCSPKEPTQRLLKAEALREEERFEDALGALAGELPKELQWVADTLRALAQQGISEVRRLSKSAAPRPANS